MVEVDPGDPGFKNPTKFIGPVYTESEAQRLKADKGWAMKKDGDKWRRVVASPLPKKIFEIRPIRWLLEKGTVVIAAGGGGIPTVYEPGRVLRGIEAVIDKDFCSELLARQLEADFFIMAKPMPTPCSSIGESRLQRRSAVQAQASCAIIAFLPARRGPRWTRLVVSSRRQASERRSEP